MKRLGEITKEWFLSKVQQTSKCWTSSFKANVRGYKLIGRRVNGKQNTMLAHRVAYELFKGPIPPGLFICHSCDNPGCCNPNHLFIGTQQDNVQDMRNKNRGYNFPKGEKHRKAKLSLDQVKDIRTQYQGGISRAVLARKYGVYWSNISAIVDNKTWRNI